MSHRAKVLLFLAVAALVAGVVIFRIVLMASEAKGVTTTFT